MKVRFLVPVDVPNPAYNALEAADFAKRMAIYPHRDKVVAPPGTEWDDPAARATLVYMLRSGIAEPLDDEARECTPEFTTEERAEAVTEHLKICRGMSSGSKDYDLSEDDEEEVEYVERLGDIEDSQLAPFAD